MMKMMTGYYRQANGSTSSLFVLFALRCAAMVLLGGVLSASVAQTFSANLYYRQCLRFEALGDLETARQSCLNALELNASSVDAKLALARVELALGNVAAAEARLNEIRNQTESAEPYVLLAEAALSERRFGAAESFLGTARQRLSQSPNSELESRFNFVEGELATARGDYGAAQRAYRSAGASEPLNPRYPLALASLLFELGDAAGARNELESYQRFAGADQDFALLSLLGRVKWALSDLDAAVSDLETAVTLRGSENTEAQAEDLRALALIYYGKGDTRAGTLALRAALSRGTLLLDVLNRSFLWLVLLVALLASHLLGESRVSKPNRTPEPPNPDAPALWPVGQIYAVLGVTLALSLGVAFAYGVARYSNYLAFLTPIQSSDVRALFFACMGVLLFVFTFLRTSRHGLDPVETVFGGADKAALGALVGLGLLIFVLLYRVYLPTLGAFYLDFSRLTPTLVAAAVLVPLSEAFFRGFAMRPLQARYPRDYAVVISGLLFALIFVSPILLLLAFGLALAEVFRRTGSGMATVVASLVLHLGLVVGVALIPWVRQLFV